MAPVNPMEDKDRQRARLEETRDDRNGQRACGEYTEVVVKQHHRMLFLAIIVRLWREWDQRQIVLALTRLNVDN